MSYELAEAERVRNLAFHIPAGRPLVALFKNGSRMKAVHYFNPRDIPTSFVQHHYSDKWIPIETWVLYSVKPLEEFEKREEEKRDEESIRRIANRLEPSRSKIDSYQEVEM